MNNRVRSNPAALVLLTLLALAVPVLIYASALAGSSPEPLLQIPFQVAAMVALAFAVVLLLGLCASWLRWLRGRPGVLGPLGVSLAITLVLLCLDVKLWRVWTEPPQGYSPTGIEVRKRSVLSLLNQNWHDGYVRLAMQQPGVGDREPLIGQRQAKQEPPKALCIAEVTVSNGLLEVTRQLGLDPAKALGQDADFSDDLALCGQQRLAYAMENGTLERLLMTPGTSSDALIQAFNDNLAVDGNLPLVGDELPEPWHTKLADLRFAYGREASQALSQFDLALMLEDADLIAFSFPRHEGPLPYQRYALSKLGMTDRVQVYTQAPTPQRGPLWAAMSPLGDPAALTQPGGYHAVDFLFANSACDADYAALLIDQGLAPTLYNTQELMLRALSESEQAGDENKNAGVLPLRRSQPGDCVALAELYGSQPGLLIGVDASDMAHQQAERLAKIFLAGYQAVAQRALDELTPEEQAQEAKVDAVYDNLAFTAKEFPVPEALRVYAGLYGQQYVHGAVCGTLSYAPWAVFHPEITEALRQLWRGWKRVLPDDAGEDLASRCRLPMLNPPYLYEPQTALRNELLEQAGLPCHIHLKDRPGFEPRSVMECQP